MTDPIRSAKADFLQAKRRLLALLKATPDDRINWAPSDTARTPLHLVAHSAAAIASIHAMLDGRPFEIDTNDVADGEFRKWEQGFTNREDAVQLLESNSRAYVAWLDALTLEGLSAPIQLPFGLGESTVGAALGAAAMHTLAHAAQLEYIQTIYGDQVWH